MTDTGINGRLSKRSLILNAAVDEFGEQGYINASTNAIAKKAGVSKGLIFHYFTDKPTLHHACVVYTLETFQKTADMENTAREKDLFERLFKWMLEKNKFLTLNRNMNLLLVDLMLLPDNDEIIKSKDHFRQFYDEIYHFLLGGIDTSNFRRDYSVDKQMAYIMGVFENFAAILLRRYNNGAEILEHYDDMRAELMMLMDFMKHGIYEKA